MSKTRVGRRLRDQVLADAGGRCGYCRSSEEITGSALEIEHLIPEALGGPTQRDNLWASRRQCNALKHDRVDGIDSMTARMAPLFNPRLERWVDHFEWRDAGAIIAGRTPTGRATVAALDLNRPLLVRARRRWVQAGWHPPGDEHVGAAR